MSVLGSMLLNSTAITYRPKSATTSPNFSACKPKAASASLMMKKRLVASQPKLASTIIFLPSSLAGSPRPSRSNSLAELAITLEKLVGPLVMSLPPLILMASRQAWVVSLISVPTKKAAFALSTPIWMPIRTVCPVMVISIRSPISASFRT